MIQSPEFFGVDAAFRLGYGSAMKNKTVYCCLSIAALLLASGQNLSAAENSPVIVRLWPDRPAAGENELPPGKRKDIHCIGGITDPKIMVYPASRTDAPAVMVCPGGAYSVLAIDLEGTEVAEWLNSIGFTAVVLKYSVPNNRDGALQDAQRAMGLIRLHSKEWNVDPARLGVLGFSAGGHLSARLSTTCETRSYPPVDEADRLSCRPDFTLLIYPAYLGDETYKLSEEIAVTTNTPPAFVVQTQDDRTFINGSIAYYLALKKQNIPSELHFFPSGGHGYGLRPSEKPVSRWPELAAQWLRNSTSNKR
jgi:acetyl esterase/lipase